MELFGVLKEISEIKPEINPYITEIEVFYWLKYEKKWELEKPLNFTFDFKVKGRNIYIEVKKGYANLTSNQVLNLYNSNKDEIDLFYIVNNLKHSEQEGFIFIESLRTTLGEFYFYKIDIQKYLRWRNRLFNALLEDLYRLYCYDHDEYRQKVKERYFDLKEKDLVEFDPYNYEGE